MQLSVREAATMLAVSEKTIYRWIREGRLSAYRVNEQYRFNRAELLEWATSRRINVSPEIFNEPSANGAELPTLHEAIRAGGIHYRVGGADKAAVLASVVELMQLPQEVNRQFLLQVLMARESLGSTGIGEGIAIPHVRNPIVMHIPRATITLCFLEKPVDFAAIDAKPVHTLFAIVSPTVRAHLHLLSKLAFSLRSEPFASVLARQGSREELLLAAAQVEQSIPSQAAAEGKN